MIQCFRTKKQAAFGVGIIKRGRAKKILNVDTEDELYYNIFLIAARGIPRNAGFITPIAVIFLVMIISEWGITMAAISKEKEAKLNQKQLKEILHYNPESGVFTWIKKTARNIRIGSIADNIDTENGYSRINIYEESYKAHRLAWLYMSGEWPEAQIDHEDHIRHNNKWLNLRKATHQENSKNRSLNKNNTSGCAGVCFSKNRNKWRSYIKINGALISLGSFIDKFDSICARKSAENKYGFHENHGRFNNG